MCRYQKQVNQIIKEANTLYNKKDEKMEAELMQLWTILMPDRELKNRISRDWIDIGFQGTDPATDFRGAGYLGLNQLLKMC